jgi:hypothetical protein
LIALYLAKVFTGAIGGVLWATESAALDVGMESTQKVQTPPSRHTATFIASLRKLVSRHRLPQRVTAGCDKAMAR